MKYEIVGLSLEDANDIVRGLWGGFIAHGHAYLSSTCFLRPEGCPCAQCKQLDVNEVRK